MKVLKFFKKTNANNKRSIKIFVNKILHLNPINDKQNIDEFKYKDYTWTSDVEEIENETEGDDDGEFNNNGNDDDDDDDDKGVVEVEIDDADNDDNDDDGDVGDNDGNRVEDVTVNEDASNINTWQVIVGGVGPSKNWVTWEGFEIFC